MLKKGGKSFSLTLYNIFGNPLVWSDGQKCIFIGIVTAPFSLFFALSIYLTINDTTQLAFINLTIAKVLIKALGLFSLWWLVVFASGFYLHKNKIQSRVMQHVVVQSWLLGYAGLAYLVGLFTTPIWIIFPTFTLLALMLVDKEVVIWALVTSLNFLLFATFLNVTKVYPYAPIFQQLPLGPGDITWWWLGIFGAPAYIFTIFTVLLMVVIAERLKVREASHRREEKNLSTNISSQSEALADSKYQLQHAQKMEIVGRLAGGIAHDFNNLLSIQMMTLEFLILDENLPGDARDKLNLLLKNSKSGSALVSQLLSFSRKMEYKQEVLELGAIIQDLESMVAYLVDRNTNLRVSRQIQPCRVVANQVGLEQVILNLVINASDALRDTNLSAEITLKVRAHQQNEVFVWEDEEFLAGEYVCLSVEDNGTGIEKKNLEKIYEPFFTTKDDGEGTGMGLSMVFNFVKESSGFILIDTELGKGSKFSLYFPKID